MGLEVLRGGGRVLGKIRSSGTGKKKEGRVKTNGRNRVPCVPGKKKSRIVHTTHFFFFAFGRKANCTERTGEMEVKFRGIKSTKSALEVLTQQVRMRLGQSYHLDPLHKQNVFLPPYLTV